MFNATLKNRTICSVKKGWFIAQLTKILVGMLLLMVSSSGILAQVNITGKVVDVLSAPLAGVRVGIAKYNLFTLTMSDGTFIFTGTSAPGTIGASPSLAPRIHAGILTFNVVNSVPVNVAVFNAQGKQLFARNIDHATPGIYQIPLMHNVKTMASGIIFIRLKAGDQVSLWRQILTGTDRSTKAVTLSRVSSSHATELAKTVAASNDTVSFTLASYIPHQQAIDSLRINMGTIVLYKEATGDSIIIAMDPASTQQVFGTVLLETALREINRRPVRVDITKDTSTKAITVRIVDSATNPAIKHSGFQISKSGANLVIKAIDQTGAMYGMQEAGDLIAMNGLAGVTAKTLNPRFPFRAIKFNLPWSSYRSDASLQLHTATMQDIKFWESFLDMMVENRFSALTLWNEHPFPYLIRATNFPNACPFTDAQLATWRNLWTSIFRMAKDRGIETYLVHWNIFVSQAYHNNYGGSALVDNTTGGNCVTSATDDQYLKESVTQLINEYPDLTGIGVTLGEGMNNWTAQEREDWLVRTEVAGMKAANRKIKFIHRAPMYSTSLAVEQACRNTIDNITDCIWPLEFEIKFNWSHAFSTPRLIKIHGGTPTGTYWTPVPTNYRIDWMMRNEDIFVLRWGQPDFIRQHIAANGQSYVNGYFLGSECYYPAKDYIHVPTSPHVTWKYAFERQWLWYKEMGRLLYDPTVTDKTFELYFDRKYGKGVGTPMVRAFKLASDAPLRFACMKDFTWDMTLYSEGFSGGSSGGGFVTLTSLINATPLDNTYYSVSSYVSDSIAGGLSTTKIKPFKLADTLQKNSDDALALVGGITGISPTLECEIMDVKAWSYYGGYFAKKLRAATLLKYYTASGKKNAADKTNAIALLQGAKADWANLVSVTKPHQLSIPNIVIGGNFSWDNYTGLVDADITTAQGM